MTKITYNQSNSAVWYICYCVTVVCVLLLGACPSLEAQDTPPIEKRIIGYDHLAGLHQNFRARNGAKYLPEESALGILDWTFSEDVSKTSVYLDSGSVVFLRVHLLNTVCVRNKNCGRYEAGYGYSIAGLDKALVNQDPELARFFRSRTRLYKDISTAYPGVRFAISPMLEHNASQKAWRQAADWVKEVWPEVLLVNNAMNGDGERYRGAWREHHGDRPRGDVEISSLDGKDVTDINVPEWLKRTRNNKVTFVWSRSDNCRTQGAFLDPRKRTACPKDYQFEELAHIVDVRPPAPSPQFSCNFAPFAAPSIWKPMAEDKGNGDSRANLPVAIASLNPSGITLVGMKGMLVGTLSYYGVFEKNLNRYYSGMRGGSNKNGYWFEKEAEKQGSPWVWIKQRNRCLGPFIPGRRAGSYR